MRTGLWEDVYTLIVDFLAVSRLSWGGIGEGSILEDEEEKVSFISSSGICVIPHWYVRFPSSFRSDACESLR